MDSNEKTNYIQKVDMVIICISDCILEANSRQTSVNSPEMVKALAELIQARAYAEHLIGQPTE